MTMRASRAVVAALVVVSATVAHAQVQVVLPEGSDLQPPSLFLEKAYFSLLTPSGKSLLFEGRPTVHYFVFNQYPDKVWQKGEKPGRWAFAWPVSALFEVRMTNTTSQPVRTPSYRIRPFYMQGVRMSRSRDRVSYRMLAIAVGAAHYSNGQQGCTYQGFERVTSDAACTVADGALAAQRKPNVIDGDFSTSYFSVAVHHRWGRLFDTSDPMKWQFTTSVEGQVHPLELKPGGMNGEQAAMYGQHQWSLRAEYEQRIPLDKLQGVLRLAGEYEERFGGHVAKNLRRGSLEVSYVLDRQSHLGIFVRQHVGFDYYNINFAETRPFLSAGLMWDVGRLDLLERVSQ